MHSLQTGYRSVILGILLIITAINLSQTPAYTTLKGLIVDLGASISFATVLVIGLIISTFLSGMFLVQKS